MNPLRIKYNDVVIDRFHYAPPISNIEAGKWKIMQPYWLLPIDIHKALYTEHLQEHAFEMFSCSQNIFYTNVFKKIGLTFCG